MRKLIFSFVVGALIGAGGMWLWMTAPKTYTGKAQIVDGDNIKIDGRNIRLVGIDAPELPKGCRYFRRRPDCTEPTSEALFRRVAGKSVSCTEVGRGVFGRTLAICYYEGEELNVWLLKNCLANSPKRKSHRDTRYEEIIASRTCPPKID